MTDKKPERIKLSTTGIKRENLSVLRLEKGYKGKHAFTVIDTGGFTDGAKVKPRLDLSDGFDREYYFVLNQTNQQVLTEAGCEYVDDVKGKSITLETYDTGGQGNFAFGIRIIEVK